ncbi:MAG: hypothetical protein F4X02_07500 [Chloroflexi bacterium]|nr:hypothetical protein [Chloroflexota bacterium]
MPKLAGDHVQVLVDSYELAGDSNRVRIDEARDLFDITAFGDEARKFSPGQRMMALQHAGFMNSAEAGSHPVLQGAAVDNGVASAGGGLACLHVLEAAASDAYVITIETSGSGAFAGEQSVLATFTLDGTALGSEQVKIAGRILRHVRWKAKAAPVASDPKYSGEFLIGSYRPQIMTGGTVLFTATLKPATGDAPEWGAV